MELTRLQQNKLDTLLLYLEQENCSPVWMIQILVNDRIASIFLKPEDIEDIQLEKQKVFFTSEEFRQLSSFAKFAHKNNIFDLEKMLNISDNVPIWNLTVHNVIEILTQSTEQDWKKNSKKFLRYYLIIESEYERQTWEELSFKGLDEKWGYEENLGT